MNVNLINKTHWVVQGSLATRNVFNYIDNLYPVVQSGEKVYFIDTPADDQLPWKPSAQLKNVLSDQNFINVYFPKISKVYYGENPDKEEIAIEASKMLNYGK